MEQLLALADELRAPLLCHSLKTPEIESSELDPPDPAQCAESEVGEEVAGEDPVRCTRKRSSVDSPGEW